MEAKGADAHDVDLAWGRVAEWPCKVRNQRAADARDVELDCGAAAECPAKYGNEGMLMPKMLT